jgi:hypothetical protein
MKGFDKLALMLAIVVVVTGLMVVAHQIRF